MTPVAKTAMRHMRRTNLAAETHRAIAALSTETGVPQMHGKARADKDIFPPYSSMPLFYDLCQGIPADVSVARAVIRVTP